MAALAVISQTAFNVARALVRAVSRLLSTLSETSRGDRPPLFSSVRHAHRLSNPSWLFPGCRLTEPARDVIFRFPLRRVLEDDVRLVVFDQFAEQEKTGGIGYTGR